MAEQFSSMFLPRIPGNSFERSRIFITRTVDNDRRAQTLRAHERRPDPESTAYGLAGLVRSSPAQAPAGLPPALHVPGATVGSVRDDEVQMAPVS